MSEYLTPGVYVEESSDGPKPIEGVPTSSTALLGQTERGPEYIKLVASWLEFQRWFGGYVYERSYLPHVVQGFFENGGKRCFVARITGKNARHAVGVTGNLRVSAIGKGEWGNRVVMEILPPSKSPNSGTEFNLRVMYFGQAVPHPVDSKTADEVEEYENLTRLNAGQAINSSSKLVRVWFDAGAEELSKGTIVPLAGGADDPVVPSDYAGRLEPLHPTAPDELLGRSNGFAGIEGVDEISLVAAPDEVRTSMGNVTTQVVDHCDKLKDRFGIISVAEVDRSNEPAAINVPHDSSYTAFYHPWIKVFDPGANEMRSIPATGHVAGIFVRCDIERGVHKAPADEIVRGAGDVDVQVNREQQGILNPKGVNCIRDFRSDGRGIRLWGARTMSSDPEWRYVNVRRLFMFVEESIQHGTQWVVFEPNHDSTWAKARRSISNFLIHVWRTGALQGVTQDDAFFVKCDRSTMTQDDIDNGQLTCYIGISPVNPAEFVIFRIHQKTVEAHS